MSNLNCEDCWNYNNCENKKRTDLVQCFEKRYHCMKCDVTECEFNNQKTSAFVSDMCYKNNINK